MQMEKADSLRKIGWQARISSLLAKMALRERLVNVLTYIIRADEDRSKEYV